MHLNILLSSCEITVKKTGVLGDPLLGARPCSHICNEINLFSVIFTSHFRTCPHQGFFLQICVWRFIFCFEVLVCDFGQIYMRPYLVLLIFRWLLLNDNMARIVFTEMVHFGLSMGFPNSPILPIFAENSYHLLPVGRYVFFIPANYFELKI